MTAKKRRKPTAYVDVLVAIGASEVYLTLEELVARSGRARSTVVDKLVEMQRGGLVEGGTSPSGKVGYRLVFPYLFKHLEY